MDILTWLIVGLVAGVLASFVVGGGYGLLGDIVVGIVGAFLGGWIFSKMGGTHRSQGWQARSSSPLSDRSSCSCSCGSFEGCEPWAGASGDPGEPSPSVHLPGVPLAQQAMDDLLVALGDDPGDLLSTSSGVYQSFCPSP